jgi:hypothetical protein
LSCEYKLGASPHLAIFMDLVGDEWAPLTAFERFAASLVSEEKASTT